MKPIKPLAIAITMILLVSAFSVAFVNIGVSSTPATEFEPIAIDDNVKDVTVDSQMPAPAEGAYYSAQAKTPYYIVGDQAIWLIYGSGYASAFAYFTLGYIGTNVEIWVANSIKYPAGDYRNGIPLGSPGPTKPTYAMMQYLADQYETNILPKESAFFGAPLYHDGSNAMVPEWYPTLPGMTSDYYSGSSRAVLLVSNIRDYSYYHSDYPYYVIGSFVSAFTDDYFDRNIINIDAVSWYHSLGPAGTIWGEHLYAPNATYAIMHTSPVVSPYAYDSTVAHEWQHLLHHEYSPGGELWMNEGCSMYSEFLCGYGIDPDYFNSYFATPDNSLVEWGDQGDINILADYGVVGAWCMYLADRYGPDILRYYFLLGYYYGLTGIEGINYALYFIKVNERFPEVYRDWKLANFIRADSPGSGKYNYKSINFNDPTYISVRLYEEDGFFDLKRGTDYGNTYTILGYDTGIATIYHWGSDYIALKNWPDDAFVYFDGDEYTVPEHSYWEMTADGWYSGTGVDLANYLLAGNAYVDPMDPTLTIVTAYGLESFWDFGFVQVSTDGGQTWMSLANTYTTFDHDPSAHPDIVANLPGLTDYNPDWPAWTTMSFDLTDYAGTTVMIGFRYMTDWATTLEGWWINSATVSGTELTLANVDIVFKAAYQVNVLKALKADGKFVYIPYDVKVNPVTNIGEHHGYAKDPTYMVLIVTPTMDKGTTDYQFKVYVK
jgi:immune inhibitor A